MQLCSEEIHKLTITTLNLNQEWSEIYKDLLKLLTLPEKIIF